MFETRYRSPRSPKSGICRGGVRTFLSRDCGLATCGRAYVDVNGAGGRRIRGKARASPCSSCDWKVMQAVHSLSGRPGVHGPSH